jgi:hypothetical protein
MNESDLELLGRHGVVHVYLGSGAGGDRTLTLEPPDGETWLVKMLTASHSGVAPIALQWFLRDNIDGENIMGPYNAAVAAAPYEYPWPFHTDCVGHMVLNPGSMQCKCFFTATAPGEDLYIRAYVIKLRGTWQSV